MSAPSIAQDMVAAERMAGQLVGATIEICVSDLELCGATADELRALGIGPELASVRVRWPAGWLAWAERVPRLMVVAVHLGLLPRPPRAPRVRLAAEPSTEEDVRRALGRLGAMLERHARKRIDFSEHYQESDFLQHCPDALRAADAARVSGSMVELAYAVLLHHLAPFEVQAEDFVTSLRTDAGIWHHADGDALARTGTAYRLLAADGSFWVSKTWRGEGGSEASATPPALASRQMAEVAHGS